MSATFESITHQVSQVVSRIEAARSHSGATQIVTLEIAGKTRSSDENYWAAQALADINQPVIIGHNRVQEALATHSAIRQVAHARVHLIGPLQKNKINHALNCVDLIETIDTLDLVSAIDQRSTTPLPVFIQVNTSGEHSKSGCTPTQAPFLIEAITQSQHLQFHGFMTIGLNSLDEAPVRISYAQLRELRDEAAVRLDVPEDSLALSMGMSRDLEWAIAEGATIVRVGTDIFGSRSQ